MNVRDAEPEFRAISALLPSVFLNATVSIAPSPTPAEIIVPVFGRRVAAGAFRHVDIFVGMRLLDQQLAGGFTVIAVIDHSIHVLSSIRIRQHVRYVHGVGDIAFVLPVFVMCQQLRLNLISGDFPPDVFPYQLLVIVD